MGDELQLQRSGAIDHGEYAAQQWTQTRSFGYTGSDMTSTTNPENGTVTYTYDGAHHVTQRTDAIGQQTRYTYDGYGRLTQVQHWGFVYVFPAVGWQLQELPNQRINYYYDTNPLNGSFSQNTWGRLAAVTYAVDPTGSSYSSMYSYNQAGRVTAQHADYHTLLDFDATYTWDTEGRMTGTAYGRTGVGGGPSYTMQYDGMGRLNGMLDAANGNASVASASYGVAGEMLGLTYFQTNETRTYNSLLQMTRQTVSGMMDMQYLLRPGRIMGGWRRPWMGCRARR